MKITAEPVAIISLVGLSHVTKNGSSYVAYHPSERGVTDPVMLYSAEQVEAEVLAEREKCAKVCNEIATSLDNEWNRKLGVAPELFDVAADCAAAIRSRSEGENP